MTKVNRRAFLEKSIGSTATAAAWLAAAGLNPRRIEAQEGFNRIAYRVLGSTGCKVSEIGFGARNMRDADLVNAAIDHGINYIDTANSYMNGVNEEVIGSVMKTKRDKVFLTTKVYVRDPSEYTKLPGMMEDSLKRLQTDHVDLMLLHSSQSRGHVFNENYMKMFEDARKRGLCRFIGTSTHINHVEVLDAVVESEFWEAVLVGYSYVSPPEVREAIARARRAGVGIIAMKTLLNPVDIRSWDWRPIEDIRTESSLPVTPAQALLKWVLDDPHVDTIIPGITSFEQLAEDVGVMGLKMSFEAKRTLRKFGENIRGHYCHGLAGCSECSGSCPKGVDVRNIHQCMSYANGYGDTRLAWENYRELPATSRVDICSDCDECTVKCAHGIDLRKTIRDARNVFA